MRPGAGHRLRLATAVGYTILTFLLSTIPGEELRLPTPYHLDLLYHAIEYAVMAWIMISYFAMAGWTSDYRRARAFGVTLLSCAVIGGLNEVWQTQVPGRFPSVADAAANIVGAGALLWIWDRRKKSYTPATKQEV